MRKSILYICIAALMILPVSCDSFLDPGRDNIYTEDLVLSHPSYAEGILLNCYNQLPGATVYQDVATDNAVCNNPDNDLLMAATGSISASNNALEVWSSSYTAIAYANHFLSDIVDNVQWATDNSRNENYKKRLSAEARALRAYFYTRLLEAHAGITSDGSLMGVPMIMAPDDGTVLHPRDSYARCLELILEDLDYAIANLPFRYANAPASDPDKVNYDAVYGSAYATRVCGAIAMAIKARALYNAATPAFNLDGDLGKWAEAADAAAALIDAHGGLGVIHPGRVEFYLDENCSDIIWRKSIFTGHNWETDNFPPSLYGNGRVNPSQGLVDAFPDAAGYPITDALSTFNPASPYAGRDTRLQKYILYNSAPFKTSVINTVDDSSDGVGRIARRSTRTGYYQKKFMDPGVSLITGNIANTRHFVTYFRYTEMYLIYAEAAFEAWGKNGKGTHAYSSEDVLAALRASAGIPAADPYLHSALSDAQFRSLILNERRIELCFENFRYWDLRRHKDIPAIQASVSGTMDGGLTSMSVEDRIFDNYMIYGPIPDSEVRKGLKQNQGWK